MTVMLDVVGLSVGFGGTDDVVRDVSLSLAAGRVTGLIGPNGAGKTTFVDAVNGLVASRGSVVLDGVRIDPLPAQRRARLGIGRTFQSLELFEDLTVAENVLAATEAAGLGSAAASVAASEAMSRFGLDDVATRLPSTLSHASRSRLAMARAVATGPRVLLLDEPAAGLDGPARDELADRARSLAADDGVAVLLVDHDLALVLDVCDEVVVLDRGTVIASGPPAAVRTDPAVVAAYLGAPELAPSRRAEVAVSEDGGRAGVPALEVSGLRAGYGGAAVVDDVSLTVAPGEIVALLGLNGAGKTTVLSAISGLIPRMAGVVKVDGEPMPAAAHLVARRGVAYVPEDSPLFAGLSVDENLALGPARKVATWPSTAFGGLLPEMAGLGRRRAGLLSGGEARMVALCRALAGTSHVLLLDEPSRGLAPKAAQHLASALRSAAGNGAAILLVEQHPALALGIADRAYLLERGRVTRSGAASEIDVGALLEGSPKS